MAQTSQSAGGLAHIVYFTLHDNSVESVQKLIADCKTYLTDHPGLQYFAVGTLSDYKRDVNDQEFDVGLHLMFADKASHDAYQVAERHNEFVARNRSGWKKVRVFDADLSA